MSNDTTPARVRLVPPALVLGLTAIFCTLVAGNVVMQTKASNKAIRVKGYAERHITSDFGIWHAQLTVRASQLALAYEGVERDMAKVTAWLIDQGVASNRFSLSAVTIETQHKRDNAGHETSDI